MAKVVYPQPIPWKFDPWRIPSDIIRDPLISFTAGQDIAAFLNPDEPLSPLADNPLTGQYYVWALGEMGFQTYGAWPVDNATNALQRIANQAPAALNPRLAKMKAGDLIWQPAQKTLVWGNFQHRSWVLFRRWPRKPTDNISWPAFSRSWSEASPRQPSLPTVTGRTNLSITIGKGLATDCGSGNCSAGFCPCSSVSSQRRRPRSHQRRGRGLGAEFRISSSCEREVSCAIRAAVCGECFGGRPRESRPSLREPDRRSSPAKAFGRDAGSANRRIRRTARDDGRDGG